MQLKELGRKDNHNIHSPTEGTTTAGFAAKFSQECTKEDLTNNLYFTNRKLCFIHFYLWSPVYEMHSFIESWKTNE